MKPEVGKYLGSWSSELISRADRVRHLIGDAHWLSDGHHKESLVREVLQRLLPPNLSICRGFVKPPDDEIPCSPENDILVSDPAIHPPFFNEGGLVITPPSNVLALIESKTTYSQGKLVEAIAAQAATVRTLCTYEPRGERRWRGVLFAAVPKSRSLESALKSLGKAVSKVNLKDNLFRAEQLPHCIASYDRLFLLLSAIDEGRYRVRAFELGSLAVACFFNELSAHISMATSTKRVHREFNDIVGAITASSEIREYSVDQFQEECNDDEDTVS